jgi:hypothetical protein
MGSKNWKLGFGVSHESQMDARFRWKARLSQLALIFLEMAVASKLQKPNEKHRRLDEIAIFLQGRLK